MRAPRRSLPSSGTSCLAALAFGVVGLAGCVAAPPTAPPRPVVEAPTWEPSRVEATVVHQPIPASGPDPVAALSEATALAATLAIRPDATGDAPTSKRSRQVPIGELHLVVDGETHELFVYDSEGTLQTPALERFSTLVGAPRLTKVRPRLLAMLYVIGRDFDRPVTLVSGVREVEAASGHRAGHADGRAADIYVADISSTVLDAYCRDRFEHAGVGHRPKSGLVHLDVRDATVHWTDLARPGQEGRERLERLALPEDASGDDPTRLAVHLAPADLVPAIPRPDDSEVSAGAEPVARRGKRTRSRKYHVVKKGDSVSRIAKRYDVEPRDIIEWNDLGKAALIRPGQKLRVRK